jgi:hypothetical protein
MLPVGRGSAKAPPHGGVEILPHLGRPGL